MPFCQDMDLPIPEGLLLTKDWLIVGVKDGLVAKAAASECVRDRDDRAHRQSKAVATSLPPMKDG